MVKLSNEIIFAWINSITVIITGIIAIPIAAKSLDVNEFNLWLILTSLSSYNLGILNGIKSTFTRYTVYFYSGGDIKTIRNIINVNQRIDKTSNIEDIEEFFAFQAFLYRIIGVINLALFIVLFRFFLYEIIETTSNYQESIISCVIVICSSIIQLNLSYAQSRLEGIGQIKYFLKYSAFFNAVFFILKLLVLFKAPTLLNIIIVYQISLIAPALFFYISHTKILNKKGIELRGPSFSNKMWEEIKNKALKSSITTISSSAIKHLSALIIAKIFIPAESTLILFTKRIVDVIEQIATATFNATLPKLIEIRTRNPIIFKKDYQESEDLVFKMLVFAFIAISITGNTVLIFFEIENLTFEPVTTSLFFIAAIMNRWSGMRLSVANINNEIIDFRIIPFIGLTFYLLLILLERFIGISSVPLASLLSLLVFYPIINFELNKICKIQNDSIYKTLIVCTLISVIWVFY